MNKLQTENELQTQKQVIKFELSSYDEWVDGSCVMPGKYNFGEIIVLFRMKAL